MVDDVLCPHCDKALPLALLEEHLKGRTSRRPTVSRALSLPSKDAAVNNSAYSTPTDAELMPPPPVPLAHGMPNDPHMRISINEGESTDSRASKATISDDDIKRWSAVAGITPRQANDAKEAPLSLSNGKEEAKAFPLLPPPPASTKPSNSRFNFFSRSKSATDVQYDSDSDDDMATGYAKLGAPASDDDDDDAYESEKPFTFKTRAVEPKTEDPVESASVPPPADVERSATPTAPQVPSTSENELRSALREVLERVQALTESHKQLSASHSSLLTTLKISRSNLIMAEANTEMLEEELRRAKAAVVRANTPRLVMDTSMAASGDQGHTRTPSGSTLPGKETKGWFGMKKPSGTLPSPIGSESGSHLRTSSDAAHPLPTTAGSEDELRRLRSQLDSQAVELETLKKGKKEIESELEGLSQALFEEANKMVADERKRRAELEDTLKEVNGERDVLKETIKVLGGLAEKAEGEGMANSSDSQLPADTVEGSWDHESGGTQTPNLDKHYAALRKSIHHVVDGPTPDPSTPGTPASDGSTSRGETAGGEVEAREPEVPGAFTPPPTFDTEPNPWANNSGSPVIV